MEIRSDPKKLNTPLKKLGFQNFISVENFGYVGGIMVACKYDKVKVCMISKDDQFFHLQVKNNQDQDWMFTVVYACPNE